MKKTLSVFILYASSALFLQSCGETETPIKEVAVELPRIETPSAPVLTSLQTAQKEFSTGNISEAQLYLKKHVQATELNELRALLDEYWKGTPEQRDQPFAILLAEEMVDEHNDAAASYLAGLAYYSGTIVDKDPSKAVKYWQHKQFAGTGAVQYRLFELYNDLNSSVYDADKAATALQKSQELGYQPK